MNLSDIDYVKGLQQNMRAIFETESGKEVMRFLEMSCGWYSSVFDPVDRDRTLVNDGRRQVVATVKTLLERAPEEIVSLAQKQQGE